MPDDVERQLVIDAVIGPTSEAYYSDRVRASSAARLRAQAAQSTITVFLGGLVGAFTITTLTNQPVLQRILGFVSVALWICAGLLYLWAVAVPVRTAVQSTRVKDRLELIDHVLKKAEDESTQIDRRQRVANYVVVGAVASSLAVFGLFLFGGGNSGKAGAVLVSTAYTTTLHNICPGVTRVLTGLIEDDPGSQFIQLRLSNSTCIANNVALRIPRVEVTAVLLEGE